MLVNTLSNEEKNLAVRPAEHSAGIPTMVERIAYYQAPQPEADSGQGGIPFAHYRWMLNRHKWRLLLFVGIAVSATIVVSKRLVPFYESTVTLDVDRNAAQAVIGQDASGSRAAFNDSELFLQTQIQLIQSDAVVRPVAQKLTSECAAPGGRDGSGCAAKRPYALSECLTVIRPSAPNLSA